MNDNENFVSFENMQAILDGISGKVGGGDDAYVGKVTWQMCLVKDHLKLDGTAVLGADYPELLAFAVDNELVTDDVDDESKFKYSDATDTLTLPDYVGLCLQGGNTVAHVAAGLPNITGSAVWRYMGATGTASSYQKAFTSDASQGTSTGWTSGSEIGTSNALTLDASRSSSIYGASTTVQPPAVTLVPQIRYRLSAAPAICTVPVGTVISFMGTQPPVDYLACDGTEYAIADQPVLAKFITRQFGSVNHFGGDGETTFAVPDLRGEFLRGTGVNSHANQGSGADVGAHQDGTMFPDYENVYSINHTVQVIRDERLVSGGDKTQLDSFIPTTSKTDRLNVSSTYDAGENVYGRITARPTNTSVLYCIRCR